MKYILLHGLGQTASSWSKTADVMDDKWDVKCPNLADWLHNESPCYETLYRALERYCEQFDEPLSLCGLSLGGILAMQYCMEHAEKVHSLVLIGTQYTMPKQLLKMQNILFRFMPSSMFSKIGFRKPDFISLCKSMMELDFTHGYLLVPTTRGDRIFLEIRESGLLNAFLDYFKSLDDKSIYSEEETVAILKQILKRNKG